MMDIAKVSDRELSQEVGEMCGFIPILEKVLQITDEISGNTQNQYWIHVKVNDEQKETRVFESISDIAYGNEWPECIEAALFCNKERKLIQNFLKEQIRNVPKERRKCWGGVSDYLEPNPLYKYDIAKKKIYLQKLLALKDIAGVLFICKVAALLKPLFCELGYTMDFFVEIFGESGTGKTTLAELFFVETNQQKVGFKTNTQKEIERALNICAGNTLLVDDYHPEYLDYAKKKQTSIVDLLARQAKKGTSALAIVTAEMREGSFSVQDRMLQVEISDRDIDWKSYQKLQQDKNVYREILKMIIQGICSNKEFVKNEIRTYMMQTEVEGEFRISFYMRLLRVSLKVLESLCEKYEMDFWNEEYSESIVCKLVEVQNKQSKYMRRIREQGNEIDWIRVLYNMIYLKEEKVMQVLPFNQRECHKNDEGLIAWYWDNKIYIEKPVLLKALEQHFGKRVSVTKMIRALKEADILETDKSSSYTKKRQNQSYYVINKSMLTCFVEK